MARGELAVRAGLEALGGGASLLGAEFSSRFQQ